jgi:hypothetical protein
VDLAQLPHVGPWQSQESTMAPPNHQPEKTTNTMRPALLGGVLIVAVAALIIYSLFFNAH